MFLMLFYCLCSLYSAYIYSNWNGLEVVLARFSQQLFDYQVHTGKIISRLSPISQERMSCHIQTEIKELSRRLTVI